MPWCDECSKFWSPNSLPATGACPSCGRVLAAAPSSSGSSKSSAARATDNDEDYKAPWHFKLMIALAVVYLSWRFIQLIAWVV